MAEYIEREALLTRLKEEQEEYATESVYERGYWNGLTMAQGIALNIPAADVVEVPCRCKDCKHWMDFPNCGCTDFVKVCALAEYMIGQNGFCLYGEKKDGE